ncbi:UDP-N-acetylmuramoyl-tripeptide--D-alanyl-D-alanine ligase [Candidatus Omnitrophota bacterium]
MLSIADLNNIIGASEQTMANTAIRGYSIDSRTVKPGDVFFAIKGEKTDGHRYIAEAEKKGAIAYVVNRNLCDHSMLSLENIMCVDNTISALQSVARYIRSQRHSSTIAITGSCGKTTVKDLLTEVLKKKYATARNEGNLNNHLGAPLSLLNTSDDHQIYIAEMGASKKGDIAELCSIVQPQTGIITNVCASHLQGFGSLQTVYETKAELGEYIGRHGGTIIADADDDNLMDILKKFSSTIVSFGMKKDADISAQIVDDDDSEMIVRINQTSDVKINKRAVLNIKNVLAVIAAASLYDMELNDYKDVFINFNPPQGRFSLTEAGKYIVVDDSYNANPASFENAITLFTHIKHKGRKICVCGDMLELGAESAQLHKQIGDKLSQSAIDLVVGIGEGGCLIADVCKSSNNVMSSYGVSNNSEAVDILHQNLKDNDMILFKGSRGMKLEEVIAQL